MKLKPCVSERIYLDANIYMDYCDERRDSIRPLGDIAFGLFRRTLSCEFEIVISDWVIEEVEKNVKNRIAMENLIAELKAKGKIIYAESTHGERSKAKKHVNWRDALHTVIAKRSGCKYVVTRNMVDFLEFSDVLEPILPEQL